MLLSKMPLYHIWFESESLAYVYVNVTKKMVEQLSACQCVTNLNGLQHPYSVIILSASGAQPRAVSYVDWDCPGVLGELNAGLIKELHKLKAKLRELGFSDRGFDIPAAFEPMVPKNDHTPFKLFDCHGRRYVSVSEKTAAALVSAQCPDFLYERYSPGNVKNPCVRLSAGSHFLSWNMGNDIGVKEIQLGDLTVGEHAAYCDLLNRLVVLDKKKPAVAKEQSFTEALYQDRKAAAVKAAQPVIIKDLAVNMPVDTLTESDARMVGQGRAFVSSLVARCHCIDMDVRSITHRYGWPDEEFKAASLTLQQACLVYLKTIEKRERKK